MQQTKNNPFNPLKILANKYLLVSVFFCVWMIFFDENSYLIHQESNQQIQELEQAKQHYQSALQKEQKILKQLKNNPKQLEKIAREKYFMHKKNEEIFVIER